MRNSFIKRINFILVFCLMISLGSINILGENTHNILIQSSISQEKNLIKNEGSPFNYIDPILEFDSIHIISIELFQDYKKNHNADNYNNYNCLINSFILPNLKDFADSQGEKLDQIIENFLSLSDWHYNNINYETFLNSLLILNNYYEDKTDNSRMNKNQYKITLALGKLYINIFGDYENGMLYLNKAQNELGTIENKDSYLSNAEILYNLGLAYKMMGNYESAMQKCEAALKILTRHVNGSEGLYKQIIEEYSVINDLKNGKIPYIDPLTINDRMSLEECMTLNGHHRYMESIPSLLNLKSHYESNLNLYKISYIRVIAMLANCYNSLGDLSNSIDIIDEAYGKLNISELPPLEIANLYGSSGVTKYHLRNFTEAILDLKKAYSIRKKYNYNNSELSTVLSNLALCYCAQGDFINGLWHIDEALDLWYTDLNPQNEVKNPQELLLLSNKAFILFSLNELSNAEELYLHIISKYQKEEYSKNLINLVYNNLATIYQATGRWSDSIKFLKTLTSDDLHELFMIKQNLALALIKEGNEEVKVVLEEMTDIVKYLIKNISSYLPRNEWEIFWEMKAHELLLVNNMAASSIPKLGGEGFNNLIRIKKLLDYTSNLFLDDEINLNDFPIKKESLSVDNLWLEIKNQLKSTEAVIEFTLFTEINWEDFNKSENYYGAYILTPQSTYPKLIKLCKSDELERIFLKNDLSPEGISKLYTSELLYNLIWAPICQELQNVITLYYSPVGYLNFINHDALQIKSNETLNKRFDLYRLSSTFLIQNDNFHKTEPLHGSIVLYGGIDYGASYEDLFAEVDKNKYSHNFKSEPLRGDLSRAGWESLPGTLKEINNIYDLVPIQLQKTIYTKISATEESFKNLSGESPEFLHIATHGFFIRKSEQKENNPYWNQIPILKTKEDQLVRSGLLFAGANNIWVKESPDDNILDDGVLTGKEIASLDLKNVKLLVLSACDSGRGQIDLIEGIYGLQRAFKEAGVKTILMTLWKVPDNTTAMFMTEFYRNLIDGDSVRGSVKKAQQYLIDNGASDPYYWAPFVVLD